MNLIVVESPTKARTISRFLGKDFLVEATMGHIKDLPKTKLGVEIENNFKPHYLLVAKKKSAIKAIKEKASQAQEVFLATDPDREGEAIAKHVEEVLNSKLGKSRKKPKLFRVVFHEITQKAVEKAMATPREIDENLVNAQVARRVLDRLVGYKLSPLLWRKVRRGLSAGRVQSVAVRLIVEREREIEAFKPEEYWEIFCDLARIKAKADSDFRVKLVKIGQKKAQVADEKQARTIVAELKQSKYKVLSVHRKEVRKNPYPPFTTSTMTQTASRILGWSAKKTMSVAQRLYERGLITYHRTDSVNLAQSAIEMARDYISENFGPKYLPDKPRIFKTKAKVAQEAHEAIRPTKVKRNKIDDVKFRKDAEILYDLVWKRFVACQMSQAIYDETRITVEANVKVNTYELRASGQIMKFEGWRKVIPNRKNENSLVLPDVKEGEPLQLIKVVSDQKFTQPPPRYNEASLIKTLEKLGIGRPSTYAPIISTIQQRQYVEKIQGKFIPTPIGVAVNDFLVKNFPKIFDYSFTAEMENDLDKVAKGQRDWPAVIGDFWQPFAKKLTTVDKKSSRVKIAVEKLGKKCPQCVKKGLPEEDQGELVIRIGRFGKFVSCSRFPECDYSEKYVEKIGVKCPECGQGEVIIRTTKKGRGAGSRGKKFYGCSRFPNCKWASWHKPKAKD